MSDGIKGKAVDSLFQPPPDHVVQFLDHLFISPVEIRLMLGIRMHLILAGPLIVLPHRAAEIGLPVVGEQPVHALAPNIIIPFGIID